MYVPETLLLEGNNKYVKAYFCVCITNALNGMYMLLEVTGKLLILKPACKGWLTGLKTECTLIANARTLALYTCLSTNCYSMVTESATEKL